MPAAPEDSSSSTSPKLHFSVVESVLFAFHQLVRKVIVNLIFIFRNEWPLINLHNEKNWVKTLFCMHRLRISSNL